MTAVPEKVENRYRTALGRALPGARVQAARIEGAFRTTQLAMEAGAWDSPMARAFSAACRSAVTDAGNAADDCVDALSSRHAREPHEVPRWDERAHAW